MTPQSNMPCRKKMKGGDENDTIALTAVVSGVVAASMYFG